MKSLLHVLSLCLTAVFLTACLNPGTTPPTTYYHLRAVDPAPAPLATLDTPLIVGPVEVSPYLDDPRLVTRPSSHRIDYNELHRWAEPLEKNIAAVVAENLSSLLNTRGITAFNSGSGLRREVHSIRIRITGFEIDEEGTATFKASVAHLSGRETINHAFLRVTDSAPVQGDTPEDRVESLNSLVSDFSVALARELIKKLEKPPQHP